MRWWMAMRGHGTGRHPQPGCPHCATLLTICQACNGNYDNGRLCQQCMYGKSCPRCRRHWTWT